MFEQKHYDDWKNFIRKVCSDYIQENIKQIGGDKIAEIDEAKFEMSITKGVCVSLCNRWQKNRFFTTVEKRTKDNLLKHVNYWILPGSTIVL